MKYIILLLIGCTQEYVVPYNCIDQSKIVPLLTAALQEAIAKIETLSARLDAGGL